MFDNAGAKNSLKPSMSPAGPKHVGGEAQHMGKHLKVHHTGKSFMSEDHEGNQEEHPGMDDLKAKLDEFFNEEGGEHEQPSEEHHNDMVGGYRG